LTSRQHRTQAIETDATSDRFSMLGSMVLWIFWPSFCSAIVPLREVPQTAINTVLALSGATLSTYLLSTVLRKGKTSIADMANAALAGGVAIGATCNLVAPAGRSASVCWPGPSAWSAMCSSSRLCRLGSSSWTPVGFTISMACPGWSAD
jgi:ammonium transporter Rh